MDIAALWNPALAAADWAVAGADLKTGQDLETAVIVSLFTDRRATADEVDRLQLSDPRGWWGDTSETYQIGSRIWLRRRAKATAQTLKDVQNDILEALQWLVDDGVVAKIDVATEWTRPNLLGAQLVLHRTGGRPLALNYSWVWQGVT